MIQIIDDTSNDHEFETIVTIKVKLRKDVEIALPWEDITPISSHIGYLLKSAATDALRNYKVAGEVLEIVSARE